jgi:phospholipase/carboxylesterase
MFAANSDYELIEAPGSSEETFVSDASPTPTGQLISALLAALEKLRHLARHMDPSTIAEYLAEAGTPEARLRQALADTPAAGGEQPLTLSAETTILAFEGLRAAITSPDGLRQAFRAIRLLPRALEALYPLAATVREVSRFFVEPGQRDDGALLDSLRARNPDTGVIHFDNDRRTKGGVSIYVPEYYDSAKAYPLVMALHGGTGHGRAFLWNWLTTARTMGAIVLAPTASGDTWSLMGPDVDGDNLARMLASARGRWNIDPGRLLLTGMSDGGTFTLLSGLQEDSGFTHLAPCAASFHPMLVELAEPSRLAGLPIYLTHGALDWMFPVRMGRQAAQSLALAGARVTYREIEDLSHVYPADENQAVLNWLMQT